MPGATSAGPLSWLDAGRYAVFALGAPAGPAVRAAHTGGSRDGRFRVAGWGFDGGMRGHAAATGPGRDRVAGSFRVR